MEDVIFAGTANRKPVGFAEVSMTVDNADEKIPVDYTEITDNEACLPLRRKQLFHKWCGMPS